MLDLAIVLLLAQAPASACGVSDEADFATSKEHPVQVGGGAFTVAARERRYLDALRGPMGEAVQYKRLGSTRTDDQQTILDRYEVTYSGLAQPVYLFLDAYHFDDGLKAPRGFTCAVPIGLAPPPPDPFLAMDAMYRVAVERANRDVAPISLDVDGSNTHGLIFDRYRRQTRAAKVAAAAGTPLNPKEGRDVVIMPMVIVAYPLRCGDDKPPVSASAVDVVPPQGAPVKMTRELASGDALARLLPQEVFPPGSVGAEFPLERPRPTDTIRIRYPDSACGPGNDASLPVKYTNGRPVSTPAPKLPEGHAATDRPVLLQAIVDVDGTLQQISYVGGPRTLTDAAIEAARGWTAEPAKLNGAPIPTPAMFQVRFTPR